MMAVQVERWLPEPGRKPAEWDVTLDPGTGEARNSAPFAAAVRGTGPIALPSPINAHDHGYGVRTLDFGAPDDALEPWIAGMRLRPRTDPYLEAIVSFGRLLASGVAGTMHCHNSLNVDRLADEAGAVIRAARQSGIRLGLSCPILDTSPFVYGGLPELAKTASAEDLAWASSIAPTYPPFARQIEAAVDIARAQSGPGIDVQLGPIGPQWQSDAALEAIAEASEAHGLRIHMHLLETSRQRRWLDTRFPDGLVRHLDQIGFLSDRLTVVHGGYLTKAEAALLAERGARLVTNPTANLRLRSGVLPLKAIDGAGLFPALGLDGTGFDDSQDIWQEIRMFQLLQAGSDLVPANSAADIFDTVLARAAPVIGAPEKRSDFTVFDGEALMGTAIWPEDDPSNHILARAHRGMVRGLWVAGRQIVQNGTIATFDFDGAEAALTAEARADAARLAPMRAEAARLGTLVRSHYETLKSRS